MTENEMTKKRYIKPEASRENLERALTEVNEKLWNANRRLEEEERTRQELLANLSQPEKTEPWWILSRKNVWTI